ncbi:MAG: hypothetical protein J6L60_06165 [Bacteroidaceae bacterium]|nr:hypothetical protein [Bacteroidaceae bacterium]
MKMPITDITNPPIVPAAKGNQKASLPVPTIKGTKRVPLRSPDFYITM